jgi:acetolactate synthase-1/2/3 large subunit
MTIRTGGRILVDQLKIQGCDRIFTVPGESFLAVLDALHDTPEIDLVVCRQEGGVAYMADADGKMTGRPGIAFVTRGPGATNASAGVHVAFQDSTPMILFVGDLDAPTATAKASRRSTCPPSSRRSPNGRPGLTTRGAFRNMSRAPGALPPPAARAQS